MDTFFKGLGKDVIRVFPGGYANWKELEEESSVRFGHDCFVCRPVCLVCQYWSDIWNVSYIELWIWNQVSYQSGLQPRWTGLKSWLFQASIRNCLNCVRNCDDHMSILLIINRSGLVTSVDDIIFNLSSQGAFGNVLYLPQTTILLLWNKVYYQLY